MLHIGDDQMIPLAHIVAILDAQAAYSKSDTMALLTQLEAQKRLVRVGSGECRSYVLTQKGGAPLLYASPISATTLLRRSF